MNKDETTKGAAKPARAPGPPAQDRFLTQMMQERKKVAVYLSSGVKLEGEIVAHDQYVILLKGAMTDAVYKHAVSTIQPASGTHPRGRGPGPREGRTPTIVRRGRPRLVRDGNGGSSAT